jgi:hypothetical protein
MEGNMMLRLVTVPAIITLAVTILRLVGELQHWPERWFSTATGGIVPTGNSWIIGITWLAAVFGAYFAVRLTRTGMQPKSFAKALLFAALGIAIFLLYRPAVEFICDLFHITFPHYLIFVWALWILAAATQYFAWPELFKTLFIYAYAARIPVACIMFFAMLGNWGTHYDYVGTQIPLDGLPRYLWLGFFPQLVGWVGFTVTLGSVAGIFVISLVKLSEIPKRNKIDHIDVPG